MPDQYEYLDLVGPKGDGQLQKLVEDMRTLVNQIREANAAAKGFEFNMSGAKNLKDVVTFSAQLAAQNEQLATTYNSLGKATQFYSDWKARSNGSTNQEIVGTGKVLKLKVEEAKAMQAAARAAEAEAKAKLAALRVQQQAEKQTRVNTQANQAAHDSLKTMSATLEQHRKSYYLLTQAERENAHIGGVLVARMQELDKQLKAADAQTGRFTRNVGNYSSAFNGLGFSIRNIASELPNLGISIRTFAQSVSNNIGPLTEALKQAREQNKLLAAEGKPTVSIGRQLAASVFSWQTAILAAVAAIT
jgi:hypothetical protein